MNAAASCRYCLVVLLLWTLEAAPGLIPGLEYDIQTSTDLRGWTTLRSVVASSHQFEFRDATASAQRFYRVFQP
jgi:hypothetical protein